MRRAWLSVPKELMDCISTERGVGLDIEEFADRRIDTICANHGAFLGSLGGSFVRFEVSFCWP